MDKAELAAALDITIRQTAGTIFSPISAFRPERFDGEVSQWARFAYFPFGGGSRGCIGPQFALLEAGIIMGSLAEKLQFASTSGQGEAEPEPLVSMRVKNGRWMVPERRKILFLTKLRTMVVRFAGWRDSD
ncbi:hypothetical protein Back11_59500 [Paenibacillus baekrokdamisoli]|uniref:Uncharacterized protein n=1 Tax=Paenibacillus baekrokdamisoli TaxID=1712516 RepID=A0A3G9J8D0_9BACL|nr:cytochrome P450 [Paenibacillus baekrokdamisoli]MBB3071359.1 hypothetical protein [Paenibacillus baekrokdamisoli]BBH24605.1 hypothetical protein Back11_59500 [Paenibacillus baekrokdamisoli]